jgi:hypothetical protein
MQQGDAVSTIMIVICGNFNDSVANEVIIKVSCGFSGIHQDLLDSVLLPTDASKVNLTVQ